MSNESDKMTFKELWEEHKQWLENSVTYLKERQDVTIGNEKERIKNKLDGMNVALHHMNESEKIYDLHITIENE